MTFLVDGAVAAQRQACWVPEEPGFYAIMALDVDGESVRVPVRMR